jgi:hypothetical protein
MLQYIVAKPYLVASYRNRKMITLNPKMQIIGKIKFNRDHLSEKSWTVAPLIWFGSWGAGEEEKEEEDVDNGDKVQVAQERARLHKKSVINFSRN